MAEEDSASEAATKVQEVAANVRQASTRRKRSRGSEAETVTRRYFEAIGAHDVDGAAAMWAPDGREDVRGQGLFIGPEGLREFIGGLIAAIPDLRVETSRPRPRRSVARCTGASAARSRGRARSTGSARPATGWRSRASTC